MLSNRKVGELDCRQKVALLALWSWCSRQRSGGVFKLSDLPYCVYMDANKPRHVLDTELREFVRLALVDPLPDGETFQVHDWSEYQPKDMTAAERMRKWRASKESGEEGA
jgi:hypothetical protein